MTRTKIGFLPIALAAMAGTGILFVSENITSSSSGSLITEANAIIGRPLTPMSYAGVARRTTARAVPYGAYGAAVVAPVVVAPAVVAPVCSQAVNAYGQIMTVCR